MSRGFVKADDGLVGLLIGLVQKLNDLLVGQDLVSVVGAEIVDASQEYKHEAKRWNSPELKVSAVLDVVSDGV